MADFGRREHWETFYRKKAASSEPSPFARAVSKQLSPRTVLLEVGCGNGRDSAFFAELGHQVTAVDASPTAIELCRETLTDASITFEVGTASVVDGSFDAVYSRFALHAMPLAEEKELLSVASRVLKVGGRFYVECRSVKDPLAQFGEVLSPTERFYGHYRRFILLDELRERTEGVGLKVVDEVEADGLAVYGDDNPVVIRLTAEKV